MTGRVQIGESDSALAVRPAGPDDAAALALAHVRAWQRAYVGLMPQQYLDGLDVADRTDRWLRRLGEPRVDTPLLVGTIDGQVVGFAAFGAARDADSGEAGELFALNVHPDHWQAGMGSALLSAAHAGLAHLGHREAVLWVVPGNIRARRFYERHGWAAETVNRLVSLQGVSVPEVRYTRRVP